MSGEADRVAELEAVIAAQAVTIEELRAQVERLERRLGTSSENSSKPPSSDDETARASRRERREAARRERKAAGRKPGKQPGAPGASLLARPDPDVVVAHQPACCGACGAGLGDAPVTGMGRRQVFGSFAFERGVAL